MRHRSAIVVAVSGVLLMFGSLSLVLAADSPATPVQRRAVLPILAGDSASLSNSSTATPTPTPPGFGCAGPRTAIRTLSDAGATFARTPSNSSVAGLTSIQKPAQAPGLERLAATETGVVRLTAYIASTATDSGGNLVVQVAQSPNDFSISAGIPLSSCANGASEADKAAFGAARVAVLTSCGATGSQPLGGKIEIEGVPHWATNGAGQPVISLWPVLAFKLADGWTCKGQPPTVTPTATPVPPIDVLYLSVDPQGVDAGGTVRLTAQSEPPGPGHICNPTFTDSESTSWPLPGVAPKATGANGSVWWDIVIPLQAAVGRGSFMVNCNNSGGNAVKIFIN